MLFFAGVSFSKTVIKESFSVGTGDNVEVGLVAGTVTDAGGVKWRSSGSGNWRMTGMAEGGIAISQNNMKGTSPRLHLDCADIMSAGNETTLSLRVRVDDCEQMEFGFGSDDTPLSDNATAFWVEIKEDGVVTFHMRGNGEDKVLGGIEDVKTKWMDEVKIMLTYNQADNTVSGSVQGPKATSEVKATALSFTPAFDQFNFELQNEGGLRIYSGYIDDVKVDVTGQ